MSIHAAIHARWSATAALTSIVPTNRFVTGPRQDDDDSLPVAQLSLEGERKEFTNSGPQEVFSSLRVQVWLRTHTQGVLLRQAMEQAFDNTAWTHGSVNVSLSRIENTNELREPDGVWQFVFDLEVTHNAIPA